MARNQEDIDRVVQSCLQAMEVEGESLDSVIARYPDLEASIRPPLEAALWLHRVKYSVDPTPEFVSGARKRLLAQIQRGKVAAPPSKKFSLRDIFADLSKPQLALEFAFVLLLVVFLVAGAGSIALASRNALPGDRLYNVKLIQEQVRLALAPTEIEDARLHAQYAQQRLVEIQTLVLRQRFEYIDEAVAGYEREVARAIELTRELAVEDASQAVALASQMDEMLSNQEMVLSTLSEQVPSQEEASIILALDRAQEGLIELADIRDRLVGTEVPTATPTPTSEPPTPTLSPLVTDQPIPAVGGTPTGTFEPAVIQTSVPGATVLPTQISEPVQPSTEAPRATPEPIKEKVKPKPTNTHRPTARPTNPNRPTQNPDK